MPPEFTWKKGDDGSWIIRDTLGDVLATYDDYSTVMKALKYIVDVEGDTTPKTAEKVRDSYEQGYKDGKANRVDSSRFGMPDYDTGWKDGEGDRIYGN